MHTRYPMPTCTYGFFSYSCSLVVSSSILLSCSFISTSFALASVVSIHWARDFQGYMAQPSFSNSHWYFVLWPYSLPVRVWC